MDQLLGFKEFLDRSMVTDHDGEQANVADALFAIADGLSSIAKVLERIGSNGAHQQHGVLEGMTMAIEKAGGDVAGALGELREAVMDRE